jgi:(1->4)-alpha-D-glucan 1-alpha-D-glucosylmutase
LQLHRDFTLDDAARLVPYLDRLGISHLYLSPILVARAGSMHGYDVVDHRHINPELGGEDALRRLADKCHASGLGIILDIVPNHMAVGPENMMWLDILEHGKSSVYARVFDIDFDSSDAAFDGKVVVPVLGEPYGAALAEGKLQLVADPHIDKLAVAYGPHRFPLRPDEYEKITPGQDFLEANLSDWQAPRTLHALLERQHFRLCWWRAAGDVINWRRFFDVNELAGLRVEEAAVYQRTHAVILKLYEDGLIDGVRVDHVDGLAEPALYARGLRQDLEALNGRRPADTPRDGPYVVVEKILGAEESLPDDWGVDGTSGYDFMNEVNALQTSAAGEPVLDALWRDVSGRYGIFETVETAARLEVLRGGFAGQLVACARALETLARASLATRDLTEESFRRVLAALISRLRVYRSYATGRPDSPPLNAGFAAAFAAARAQLPADDAAFAFLLEALAGRGEGAEADRVMAVRRLNQLTSPVAAKAVEDTAFYRYGRLLSRNDVGFDAGRMSMDKAEFLHSGAARARDWPRAMLATATHDHKRGEDVRARLAVLSELPEIWRDTVRQWLAMTMDGRPDIIATDDAYTLFQTLVGAWPLGLRADDADGLRAFGARVAGWREKSLREAKMRSSWAAPDEAYEKANLAWLDTLLEPGKSAPFLHSVEAFVARVAPAGAVNGVVQAALRCAWPGVPDLYQGAELWDFSLVDPDNRRPVDYAVRSQLLQQGSVDWMSGGAKQAVIASLLALRRADPALFRDGDVEALEVRGVRAGHVLAFRRQLGNRAVNIAVMLHVAQAVHTLGDMPHAAWWGDTAVQTGEGWRDAAEMFASAAVHMEDWVRRAAPPRPPVTHMSERTVQTLT